jgi:lipoate-protein ligase B
MEHLIQLKEKSVSINKETNLLDTFISDLEINKINFVFLGKEKYLPIWNLQKELHTLRKNNEIPDVVLLLEHQNVYTFGKNADKDFLLDSHLDAEVYQTDRGGQVTFHGPGQLVGYPILNLHNYKKSITWFMNSLQNVIINTLNDFNIESNIRDGYPGVWVEDEKICAMGVRIAQWVTMHGFALNVDPDMKYFDGMIPCGIRECGVTSIKDQLNSNIKIDTVLNVLIKHFNKVFTFNK